MHHVLQQHLLLEEKAQGQCKLLLLLLAVFYCEVSNDNERGVALLDLLLVCVGGRECKRISSVDLQP